MTRKEHGATILLKYASTFFPHQNFVPINLGLEAYGCPAPATPRFTQWTSASFTQFPVSTQLCALTAVTPRLTVHSGSEHLLIPWVWRWSLMTLLQLLQQPFCLFCCPGESCVFSITSEAACPGAVLLTSPLSQHWREGSLPPTSSAGSQQKVLITLISKVNCEVSWCTQQVAWKLNTSFWFCFVFWVWS